ncbi:MAG: DUF2059 domain-containing protein [Pseudomonadota bacterium]|jgi:hypothetical protein
MRTLVLALGALALAAGSASAQTAASLAAAAQASPAAAAPAALAPQVDAKKLELVRRYMDDIHIVDLMNAIGGQLANSLMESLMAEHKEITPAEKAKITKAFDASAREVFPDYFKQVLDASQNVFADAFSEEELKDLVAFYESPTGRSLVAKQPAIAQRTNQIVTQALPALQTKFKASFQAHLCAEGLCQTKGKK